MDLASIIEFWDGLGTALQVTIVLGAISLLLGAGILPRYLQYRRNLPRLRISLRRVGITRDDPDLILDVANHGGTATSIYPVISMTGRIPTLQRKFWYPGELSRLFPTTMRRRVDDALKIIRVPRELAFSMIQLRYDFGREENLRVETHEGARSMTAIARDPSQVHPMVFFRVFEVREEGPGRRYRVYTTYDATEKRTRLAFWFALLRHGLMGPPKSRGGTTTLEEWRARQRGRD